MRLVLTSVLLILVIYVVNINAWWGSSSSSSRVSTCYRFRVPVQVGPKEGLIGYIPYIGKHSGVVATTKNGERWLVHKGGGYGRSSSTVVTDAKHMSNRWRKTDEAHTSGRRIADVVKDGYGEKNYNVLTRNCHHASRNIMDRSRGRRRKRSC